MTPTNPIWFRMYANGLDISGTARDLGTFGVSFDAKQDMALADKVMNVSLGRGDIACGPVNAFLSPGTLGPTEQAVIAQQTLYIMRAWGIGAEPTVGDPMAAWVFNQSGFEYQSGDGFDTYTIPAMQASILQPSTYNNPYGVLAHGKTAETAVNTAVGTLDNGAASALGGVFWWQLLSSNGTVTLSLDDSATNANNAAFAALSGATSGSVDASVTPKYGYAALGLTAAVRRYLRWQAAFGTATTATFLLGFTRRI